MTETNEMPVKGTRTHPYVAALMIDPVMWGDFEADAEDRPEMKIRQVDRGLPDTWTIYVACASQAVKDRLEEAW